MGNAESSGTVRDDPVAGAPAPARRRSAAEEARTLVAGTNVATLATLSEDGHPWASLVTFGLLGDGSPVLCVSVLAEHGRNLEVDPRASLLVAAGTAEDPLATGRVTLLGRVARPAQGEAAAVRAAHPTAPDFEDFHDFSLWVLRVERVRWVGGYGRMDSPGPDAYRAAEPDPVAPQTAYAVEHLNADHPDALLAVARALGGRPDASAATCSAADRYGLDLAIETPRGRVAARVGFAEPATAADGLRAATIELTHRARASLALSG